MDVYLVGAVDRQHLASDLRCGNIRRDDRDDYVPGLDRAMIAFSSLSRNAEISQMPGSSSYR